MIISISGSVSVGLDVYAHCSVLEFLWCSVEGIQKYLDAESVIAIGGGNTTYSLDDAIRIENDVVRDIISFLSSVYEIDVTDRIEVLIGMAEKLTSAMIGATRFSASMGISESDWISRYKNEVWAFLRRSVINQNITELRKKNVPLYLRVIYAKTRERAVVGNV